jgi:hypothetical protein
VEVLVEVLQAEQLALVLVLVPQLVLQLEA